MELNLTTFIFEIINFLVLVWILKRFLYAPIKRTIEQRKSAIQKDLQDAENMHKAALDLQQKYENRLKDWEQLKAAKTLQLKQELDEEKKVQLEKLQKLLEKEKEKNQALVNRQIADIINKKEQELLNQATKFIAKMLSQLASQDLENRIIDLFVENFQTFPSDKILTLKNSLLNQKTHIINVKTAFLLEELQKAKLTAIFEMMLNEKFEFNFSQDEKLLAGAQIELGHIVLHLNLKNELAFFTQVVTRE